MAKKLIQYGSFRKFTEGQTKRLYEHLKRCPGERTVEAGHIDQETENVEDGEVHSIE